MRRMLCGILGLPLCSWASVTPTANDNTLNLSAAMTVDCWQAASIFNVDSVISTKPNRKHHCVRPPPISGIEQAGSLNEDCVTLGIIGSQRSSEQRPHPTTIAPETSFTPNHSLPHYNCNVVPDHKRKKQINISSQDEDIREVCLAINVLFTGPTVRSFLPKARSKQMRETYNAVSINDSPRKSISSSDDDDIEILSFLRDGTSQSESDTKLLKQCFLWIMFSTTFIFAITTTIVISGTAKCRNHQNTERSIPKNTPIIDPMLAHQKALSMFPNPKNTPKDTKSCGPNTATAIAKGCHLDMISFTWLPYDCYDAELSADFMGLNEWTWELDSNGTQRVTKEQILAGQVQNGWVTFEYHITHCLYTWKKLVRHLERGGVMDWYVMAYDHTRHCSDLLLKNGVDQQEFQRVFRTVSNVWQGVTFFHKTLQSRSSISKTNTKFPLISSNCELKTMFLKR